MNNKNKAVLITGGAKRVGAALSRAYAQAGYYVLIHCNSSKSEADKLALEISNHHLGASVIDFDLSKGNCAMLIEIAKLLCKRLDLRLETVVNNASAFEYDNAETFTAACHDKHMRVNYQAPVTISMAFYSYLNDLDLKGNVIQILDQKLDNLNVDYFSYTLSKEALRSSIKMMAMSCAPHMRVNAVLPGLMLVSGEMNDWEFKQARNIAALGQSNSPEELAEACLYLSQASKVTGQFLCVDGGTHLIPSKRDVAFEVIQKAKSHV